MADQSFSFDPAAIATASDAASDALSKIGGRSATWDKASAASEAAASAASKAAAASSAVTTLDAAVIKSVPGAASFAVHEIMRTSAGLVKFVYSSVAAS
jgi:hypothetical protein